MKITETRGTKKRQKEKEKIKRKNQKGKIKKEKNKKKRTILATQPEGGSTIAMIFPV